MTAASEDTVLIRQIQGLTVLLTCLPAGGRLRQLFTLALESDERPWLDRVGAPDDPDSADGMKAWLEGMWAPDRISEPQQKIVDWQNDSDNMATAIAELRTVAGGVRAG
jgi:hypothetical protein